MSTPDPARARTLAPTPRTSAAAEPLLRDVDLDGASARLGGRPDPRRRQATTGWIGPACPATSPTGRRRCAPTTGTGGAGNDLMASLGLPIARLGVGGRASNRAGEFDHAVLDRYRERSPICATGHPAAGDVAPLRQSPLVRGAAASPRKGFGGGVSALRGDDGAGARRPRRRMVTINEPNVYATQAHMFRSGRRATSHGATPWRCAAPPYPHPRLRADPTASRAIGRRWHCPPRVRRAIHAIHRGLARCVNRHCSRTSSPTRTWPGSSTLCWAARRWAATCRRAATTTPRAELLLAHGRGPARRRHLRRRAVNDLGWEIHEVWSNAPATCTSDSAVPCGSPRTAAIWATRDRADTVRAAVVRAAVVRAEAVRTAGMGTGRRSKRFRCRLRQRRARPPTASWSRSARFILEHLRAIAESDVPIERYYHWCFVDNWEWADGEEPRFGIVHLDYGTQERTVKPSGRMLAELAVAGRITPELHERYTVGRRYPVADENTDPNVRAGTAGSGATDSGSGSGTCSADNW